MYDTVRCNVLFGICSVLEQYYVQYDVYTTVNLFHQDYFDAINVSVLYAITGSIFVLMDSGNKNNLRKI